MNVCAGVLNHSTNFLVIICDILCGTGCDSPEREKSFFAHCHASANTLNQDSHTHMAMMESECFHRMAFCADMTNTTDSQTIQYFPKHSPAATSAISRVLFTVPALSLYCVILISFCSSSRSQWLEIIYSQFSEFYCRRFDYVFVFDYISFAPNSNSRTEPYVFAFHLCSDGESTTHTRIRNCC